MNTTTNTTVPVYEEGDTFCRTTGWFDVVKFFALNFGLHAVTVLTEPGSKPLAFLLASFTAVLMPSVGVKRAFDVVKRFALWGGTDLDVALRSDALCMLVPAYPSTRLLPPIRGPPLDRKESESGYSGSHSPTNDLPGEKETLPPDVDTIKSIPTVSHDPRLSIQLMTQHEIQYRKQLLDTYNPVFLHLTHIHGVYPGNIILPADPKADTEGIPYWMEPTHAQCSLVRIPSDFVVCPFGGLPNTKNRYEVVRDKIREFLSKRRGSKEQEEATSAEAAAIPDQATATPGQSTALPGGAAATMGAAVATSGAVAAVPGQAATTPSHSTATGNPESKKGPISTEKEIEAPIPNSGPRLACNFNFIKSVAAIVQIVYGSIELYQVEGGQLDRYGYASYELTVIPYVLMSLANLIASLTGPRYPARYMVQYRGLRRPLSKEEFETRLQDWKNSTDPNKGDRPCEDEMYEKYPRGWWCEYEMLEVEKRTRGAVGVVYGRFTDLDEEAPGDNPKKSERKRLSSKKGSFSSASGNEQTSNKLAFNLGTTPFPGMKDDAWDYLLWLLSLAFMAGPYIILQLLTQFKPGRSTLSQRAWIMSWVSLGQLGSTLLSIVVEEEEFQRRAARQPKAALALTAGVTALLSISTFGGFVVVSQMMIRDTTCKAL